MINDIGIAKAKAGAETDQSTGISNQSRQRNQTDCSFAAQAK